MLTVDYHIAAKDHGWHWGATCVPTEHMTISGMGMQLCFSSRRTLTLSMSRPVLKTRVDPARSAAYSQNSRKATVCAVSDPDIIQDPTCASNHCYKELMRRKKAVHCQSIKDTTRNQSRQDPTPKRPLIGRACGNILQGRLARQISQDSKCPGRYCEHDKQECSRRTAHAEITPRIG